MEIFNFDAHKCIEARNLLNKDAVARNVYREHCAPARFIGSCTELYRKLQPKDYIDFYLKEIEYANANQHLPIEVRGLDYTGFYNLAVKYQNIVESQCANRYDLSVYYYALLCHAIVETFVGQKVETEVEDFLKIRGFDTIKPDPSKDAMEHVDVAVRGINGDFYIQVKPISFFLSRYQDTEADRIEHCIARERVLKTEKVDTYYIIYDRDWETAQIRWLKNNNETSLFHINDLFHYDKEDINATFTRLPINRRFSKTLI